MEREKTELEVLCEEYKIEVEITAVHYAVSEEHGAKPLPHFAMTAVLKFEGRTLMTPFRCGIGWGIDRASNYSLAPAIHQTPETRYYLPPTRYPTAADILGCLVTDASFGMMTHAEFCENMGEDPDSRRVFKVWESCVGMAGKVRDFIRSEELLTKLQEAER